MTSHARYSLAGRLGFCLAPASTASAIAERVVGDRARDLIGAAEEMTDDCVRDEIGRIETVPPPHRLYGDDAAVAMAGFAHWDLSPTHFSDGTYPVFKFALQRDAAIEASRRKLSAFFSASREPPMAEPIVMALYSMTLGDEVADLRGQDIAQIAALVRGKTPLRSLAPGVIFTDPAYPLAEWIAAFEARLIVACIRTHTIAFSWDGKSIASPEPA